MTTWDGSGRETPGAVPVGGVVRPHTQIHAMRDQVHRRLLINGGEMAQVVLDVLDWACNPYAPDSVVTDLADVPDPDGIDENDPDAAETLYALKEVVNADDHVDAKAYLARVGEVGVTEIAAAARRLDRLCKKELKGRS